MGPKHLKLRWCSLVLVVLLASCAAEARTKTKKSATKLQTKAGSKSDWTSLKPPKGVTAIYVSTSDGDDRNAGTSPKVPVKTPQKAQSLTHQNSNDWILFKRGDTFNGAPQGYSGKSA